MDNTQVNNATTSLCRTQPVFFKTPRTRMRTVLSVHLAGGLRQCLDKGVGGKDSAGCVEDSARKQSFARDPRRLQAQSGGEHERAPKMRTQSVKLRDARGVDGPASKFPFQ